MMTWQNETFRGHADAGEAYARLLQRYNVMQFSAPKTQPKRSVDHFSDPKSSLHGPRVVTVCMHGFGCGQRDAKATRKLERRKRETRKFLIIMH